MTIQFKYAAFTDVGLIRKSNQDAGYASSHLLVLADGMGGAAGGDIASSVVVGHLAKIDDTHQADELLPLLRKQLNRAHEELIERVEEDDKLAGLGTTCIAILRTSNKLGMVHVGDSRAYLLRDGRLAQVTRDHTLVQYLVDHGQITKEEAENHPKRNVIMRNIGDSPDPLELDESIRAAAPGDRWLLTSDGLFDVVSRETIEETLKNYTDLDECGEKLIALALAGGAPDNVTVVLADVIDTDSGVSYSNNPVIVGSAAVNRKAPTRAGSSAAGQAAALSASQRAPEEDDDDVEETKPRRLAAKIAVVIALFAILAGGLGGGYAWTQSQYFVAPYQGNVAIYKGIPQDVGPITLSHMFEESDIAVTDLTQVAQVRLRTPITRSSLEEARSVVENFKGQIVTDNDADPADEPSDSPTPSVFPSTRVTDVPAGGPSSSDDPTSTGTDDPAGEPSVGPGESDGP